MYIATMILNITIVTQLTLLHNAVSVYYSIVIIISHHNLQLSYRIRNTQCFNFLSPFVCLSAIFNKLCRQCFNVTKLLSVKEKLMREFPTVDETVMEVALRCVSLHC